MNTSFAEKVALITGGTSGIGRATAVAFAEQGANVVISGRREAEGAESLSLIQKAGGQGLFVRGDVGEESEIEALVAKTLERFGQLDFAFNNAGLARSNGFFAKMRGIEHQAMKPRSGESCPGSLCCQGRMALS